MNIPQHPVLLTGASGALGQMLARELAGRGWKLRLTDRAPFPGAVPEGASFTLADLNDGAIILASPKGAARSCISAAFPSSIRSKP